MIDLTFLTSKLSATALIGRLFVSKFLIIILDLSLITVPLHLLGLKGLMGVMVNLLESKFRIGPCADKLYAVLPAGVETITPSEIKFLIIFFVFKLIEIDEVVYFVLKFIPH